MNWHVALFWIVTDQGALFNQQLCALVLITLFETGSDMHCLSNILRMLVHTKSIRYIIMQRSCTDPSGVRHRSYKDVSIFVNTSLHKCHKQVTDDHSEHIRCQLYTCTNSFVVAVSIISFVWTDILISGKILAIYYACTYEGCSISNVYCSFNYV